jgi:leucyl aminopeptidase
MDIRVESRPFSRSKEDAVLVFATKGKDGKARLGSASVRSAGAGFAGALRLLEQRQAFAGAAGQTAVLHDRPGSRVETLVVAGVGDERKASLVALREAAAEGARAARDAGAKRVSVVLPESPAAISRADTAAEAVTEGVRLGLYVFEAYKSEKSKKAVESVTILAPRAKAAGARRGVAEGQILSDSVLLVRDLGNEPGNTATPTYLADRARSIAAAEGLQVRILERDDMKALGMGSLLGVAQGSAQPPKLIVLTHEPKTNRRVDTVAVVGKGLTFDSGGISIKPAEKMEDMKFDMCGGAAVLGVLQAVARLRLPLRVVGLVPASENLPGGNAYKPGDILKASNGVTIEVVNTDAEGRLILADALSYATGRMKPKPSAVVDMATLTGACVVALGGECAGLVSNDDRLAGRLFAAGEETGDALWRLPLKEGYRKQIQSVYADVKNSGGRSAGALTAAAFLEKFVAGTPWAHLDIAGTAWTEASKGTQSKGATGFGVRVVTRMLQAWSRR